jgi:signal transduction histidine kinase
VKNLGLRQKLATAQTHLDKLARAVKHFDKDDQSSEDALRIVMNAISGLANALDSIQTSPEFVLQQHLEEEQWLGAIAQQLYQAPDPHSLLTLAVTALQTDLNLDRVLIYRNNAPSTLEVTAEAGSPEWPTLKGQTLNNSNTIEGLAQTCASAPCVIEHLNQAVLPTDLLTSWNTAQVKSALIIALWNHQTWLGYLCLHQCDHPRAWQASELKLVQRVANLVAIALHQAERYCQTHRLNQILESELYHRTLQVQQILDFESTLKRITDKVRDSLDESQILQTVVCELTLLLELGGCNASLYDLERGTSTVAYEYTRSAPAYQGRVAQMNDAPELYHQLQRGHYFQFCSLHPNPERGRVALLACPIFVDSGVTDVDTEQKVLGDLWLIHYPDYVFSEVEIRLVQQVANQCAIAIRQARLYQAAQGQVSELERLNRLKDEFLSTVSHELRTPISNVKMAIHMLKMAPTEERRQRYLAILEAESEREAELINDLLDLQRLEVSSYPISVVTQPICDWLTDIVEPFYSRISNHQQQFSVDCSSKLRPISTDFDILRRILAELLNNACKYTLAGHQIQLHVSQADSPYSSTLSFSRTTIFEILNQASIPPSELPHIFEKFYRVPHADPWKQGGTGLGLALVQKLVEQLNGSIHADSQDGWTRFTVEIPDCNPPVPIEP